MKKFLFLGWLFAIAILVLLNFPKTALIAILGLFVWLIYETKARLRFRFLAKHPSAEKVLTLSPKLHVALASQADAHILTIEEGPLVSAYSFEKGSLLWQRSFDSAPQAVLGGSRGILYYATDSELVVCDSKGRDTARISFEPPLYRQSYSLHLSKDGSTFMLQTPWFVQFASPDLKQLGQRISYEEVGHYIKYAALSADGQGLLLAGALLLEDDAETTAAMEARWDYWTQSAEGRWTQAWAKAYDSYNNSHLRSVAIQGKTLLAELYQSGYEFRLYAADGTSLWERPGGERALLSGNGHYLCWQSDFEGIQLSQVHDKKQLWARKPVDTLRLKAVDDEGRVLLLEGRHLLVIDVKGHVIWEDWFKQDPSQISLGPRGRLCVALDAKVGCIQVPFDI